MNYMARKKVLVINDVECRIFPEKCSRNEKYLGVADFAHIILHLVLDVSEIQNYSQKLLKITLSSLQRVWQRSWELLGALLQKFLIMNKS